MVKALTRSNIKTDDRSITDAIATPIVYATAIAGTIIGIISLCSIASAIVQFGFSGTIKGFFTAVGG